MVNSRARGALRRVLIVETDSAIRSLLEALLRHEGFDIAAACDRQTALQHAKRQAHDVVIVDPRMQDGDRLLEELHATSTDGHPNIIVLTTPDSRTQSFAQHAGVLTVLHKPFGIGELTDTVVHFCDQPVKENL